MTNYWMTFILDAYCVLHPKVLQFLLISLGKSLIYLLKLLGRFFIMLNKIGKIRDFL